MRNELQRHKKSDKIKWALTAVAFILFAIFLTGVCLQVFGTGKVKPTEWFKKSDNEQTNYIPDVTDEDGNEIKTDGTAQSMPKNMIFHNVRSSVSATENAEENTETRVRIFASVQPSDFQTTQENIRYSLSFQNPNSAWAIGKTVTDYVYLDNQDDDGRGITVVNKAPFAEQIVVTVTLTQPNGVTLTDSCVCDYKAHIVGVSLRWHNNMNSPTGFDWQDITALNEQCGGTVTVGYQPYSKISKVSFPSLAYSTDTYTLRENGTIEVSLDYTSNYIGWARSIDFSTVTGESSAVQKSLISYSYKEVETYSSESASIELDGQKLMEEPLNACLGSWDNTIVSYAINKVYQSIGNYTHGAPTVNFCYFTFKVTDANGAILSTSTVNIDVYVSNLHSVASAVALSRDSIVYAE